MSTWNQITAETPDLAARVQGAFDEHKHKVMATLRADGSPRVSGTEVDFADGEMWIGSMPNAMKALDLQRDPRVAIHSAPIDLTMQKPDAKIAGRAVELTDEGEKKAWADARPDGVPPGPFHLFRLDITEIVCTSVANDQMTVESWHEGRGTTSTTR
jgi:hypothetical protein